MVIATSPYCSYVLNLPTITLDEIFSGEYVSQQGYALEIYYSEVVKDYIQQNFKGDLSLTHLAELVYLTPAYLSRLFRLNNGQSVTDYITDRRLEQAK